MLGDLSRLRNFVWPHEEDPKERLLLDPIPQEEMNQIMLRPMLKQGPGYWLTVAILALVVVVALFGYWFYMVRWGMGVAGIRRPVGWGVFIATFVFWIGISHSGTFISAILRVFNAEFRRPITRAAELMTSFSLICGFLFPVIHLGRAWTVYYMVPIPNQRYPLGELPVAADVGYAGHHDLPDQQHHLCLPADDPRSRDGARSDEGLATHPLQADVARLARHGVRVALPAQGD